MTGMRRVLLILAIVLLVLVVLYVLVYGVGIQHHHFFRHGAIVTLGMMV